MPYNIQAWSDDYVAIAADGQLTLNPNRDSQHTIVLSDLVNQIKAAGLRLPVLVRSPDILHDRVNSLVNAFNEVIERLNYQAQYRIVYPIKVNQQRRVVEEVIRAEPARSRGQVGLEAGSKPELLAVLALSLDPGSVIVCNGYKDREYIRMALMGQALGYEVYLVVEKLSELNLILEEARSLGLTPKLGIRARLSSIGKGNWQNTGGEKSKFGLSSGQILAALETLKEAGQTDSLQLLHFHLGSQIANIRDIHRGLQECAKIYSQLSLHGATINTVDIGGGLGVDYDGTRSRNICSINYQLSDYAFSVVQAFSEECERHDLPHPHLISESGRAITAHHAFLITDVVATEANRAPDLPVRLSPDAAQALQHLERDLEELSNARAFRSAIEIYHDASHALEELQNQFVYGAVSLLEKSQAEQLYTAICTVLKEKLSTDNREHRDLLDKLDERLAEKLFVNFSLFQSMPDIWGIDQIFPILPLRGLDKPLTRRVVIQDITCDSDGRIDHYVSNNGIENCLRLPDADGTELLVFFMVGAYQEILGDMHNLFGDTDSVDVRLDGSGAVTLDHAIRGDTIASVLQGVNLSPDYLMKNYRNLLQEQSIPEAEQEVYLRAFETGLASYTYLSYSKEQ